MKPSNLSTTLFSTRSHKFGTHLAAAAVAIALLLGASPAQAEAVVTQDPSGNATAIRGC